MSKIIEGNILDIEEGIIVQQVNCQGVMGAGLAKQIRSKHPIVYKRYKQECDAVVRDKFDTGVLLGLVHTTCVSHDPVLYIINLFGQDRYDREKKYYTDYSARDKAWRYIYPLSLDFKCKVYASYYIGANLAGGDWEEIYDLAERYIKDIIWVKYVK